MIGWTPQQVDHMSLWQFTAAAEGYREAHGGKGAPTRLSDAEAANLTAWLDEPPIWEMH